MYKHWITLSYIYDLNVCLALYYFIDSLFFQTNGTSNGLLPMLRVYNNTARYVDQGGNKRPGAFAIYLEPWHADVYDFLDCRKNTGMYGAVKYKVFQNCRFCIHI